jgi:uncharacterized coiled-coil DUF342 family protein
VQKVFYYIYDIINFSKEISISNIPQYIKEKKKEKERLEGSIQDLNKQIIELQSVEKEKTQEIQRLSKISNKLSDHYRLFSLTKYKLDQQGISLENLDQFVECIKGIAKENYDVAKVLERFGDYDNFLHYIDLYKNEVNAMREKLNLLNQEINFREDLLGSYRVKLDIAEDLERMGFGINELRILYNTLMEIARENNTENKTFENIKKEFFNDLKNYDEIIRSRNKKDRLQKDIKNLEIKLERERENNNAYPRAIESI